MKGNAVGAKIVVEDATISLGGVSGKYYSFVEIQSKSTNIDIEVGNITTTDSMGTSSGLVGVAFNGWGGTRCKSNAVKATVRGMSTSDGKGVAYGFINSATDNVITRTWGPDTVDAGTSGATTGNYVYGRP